MKYASRVKKKSNQFNGPQKRVHYLSTDGNQGVMSMTRPSPVGLPKELIGSTGSGYFMKKLCHCVIVS